MSLCRIALSPSVNAGNMAEITHSLYQAGADDNVRVVVLHGSEGVFCNGLDLSILSVEDKVLAGKIAPVVKNFALLLREIFFFPKPVIAEVTGEAKGGGVGLAAACDVVIASHTASFGLPELLYGLIPAMITPVLLQRITPQKLRYLSLCCHAINALEAQKIGLADIVVDDSEIPGAIQRLSRQLRRPELGTIPLVKQFIAESMAVPVVDMIARGAEITSNLLLQDHVQKAVRNLFREGTNLWQESGQDC